MNFERQKIDVTRLPDAVRHKWGADLLAEGFLPFPKTFLRTLSKVLEGGDLELLQVILAIVDYDRPRLRSAPSAAYLAHLAGISEKQFMYRVADLVRMGLCESSGDADNLTVNLGRLKEKISALIAEEEECGGGFE